MVAAGWGGDGGGCGVEASSRGTAGSAGFGTDSGVRWSFGLGFV